MACARGGISLNQESVKSSRQPAAGTPDMQPRLQDSLHKISVRTRLIALVVMVALAFSASGLNLWYGNTERPAAESAQQSAKADALRDVQTAFGEYRYWRLAGLTENTSESRARAKVQLELAEQSLKRRLVRITSSTPEIAQAIAEQTDPSDTQAEDARHLPELRARLDSLYDRIGILIEGANEAAAAAGIASQPGSQELIALVTLLVMAALAIAGLIGSIMRPLRQLVAGAGSLTTGALHENLHLPVKRGDEFGTVARALDQFRTHAQRWDHEASHDPLTGFANRASLERQLPLEIAAVKQAGTALMLLYIELGQLDSINDTFGPAAGDEFLRIAARRLRSSLPESTRLFYLGGAHFVALPTPIANDAQTIANADKTARTLVGDISRTFTLQEQELEMAVKIGIVTSPQDGTSYEDLIANGYAALAQARRSPGSFQFYTRQITEKSRHRISLASQLRRAVDSNELRVHYQPVLNVITNQVVAAEALMRWQHPTRGLLMPGEFIQVAEESGAINAMGEWCLAHACADARRWREQGLEPIKLAVNLSARQLSEPGLVDTIQRTLEHAKLVPSDLELEITESTVMQDPDSSVRVLRHLKSIGISLSVDDFGTGYSSLTYLQRFPLDKIKIDRSFVSRLNRRRKDELIIAATTGLATGLDLQVVAEGVETPEQMRALRQLGCHLMQGFLFSRGLPFDEFVQWARAPVSGIPLDGTLN